MAFVKCAYFIKIIVDSILFSVEMVYNTTYKLRVYSLEIRQLYTEVHKGHIQSSRQGVQFFLRRLVPCGFGEMFM